LALGALAMHQSGLEAAFFQPAHDLVLGEADIRLDPHIRYKSALYIRINRLAVNLQHRALARYGPSGDSMVLVLHIVVIAIPFPSRNGVFRFASAAMRS